MHLHNHYERCSCSNCYYGSHKLRQTKCYPDRWRYGARDQMQLGDSPIEKKARQAVGLPCFFSSTERLFHNRYLHQRLISDYADCYIHTVILIFFLVPLFSHKRALIEIKEQYFPPKRLCSCRRNDSKKEGIHQLLKTQRLSNGWRYGSGDQVQVKHCSHVT